MTHITADSVRRSPRLYLTIQLTKSLSNEHATALAEKGAVVPSLHRNRISADLLSQVEQYVYIPMAEGERWQDMTRWVAKLIPRSSFEPIGPTRAKQVDELIQFLYEKTESSLADNSFYRVTSGRLKGFFVKITNTYETEVDVSPIFGPNIGETYRIPKGALTQLTEEIVKSKRGATRSVRAANQVNNPHAFVIDGHNMLYRSAFGNYKTHHSQNKHFVGAAMGFYYTTYRLCRAYPEHEMHFVFDPDYTVRRAYNYPETPAGKATDSTTVASRKEKMPEYKANRNKLKPKLFEELSYNLLWVLHFLNAVGFPIYSHPDHEGDNIIGTVVARLKERDPRTKITIYSTDTDMLQLVDENVQIYHPKTRSFDFNEVAKDLPKVLAEWPVGHPSKINWVRGILGDTTDQIPSFYKWRNGTPGSGDTIFKTDVCAAARDAATISAFRQAVLPLHPAMEEFLTTQFTTNIELLTIVTDIPGLKIKPHKEANEAKLQELLKNIGLYKELEQLQERVIPAFMTTV